MKRGLAIFLIFFGLFLVSGSRERPWGDANPVYQVAENLVRSGSLHTTVRWPYDAKPGRDGKYYAANPLLTSLVHVPGVLVRGAVAYVAPGLSGLMLPIAAHLGPAALGALTCLLFFALARRFVSTRAATLTTVAVGLATTIWVYARYPYSEILQAACFTGFALGIARVLDDADGRAARFLGIWAGLLVNSKLVYLAALPGAALVIAWQLRRDPRRLATVAAWSTATFVPLLMVIPFYNWLRYGSALTTGYAALGTAAGSLWIGLAGMVLSLGKSVFIYSPPLLVALFGVPALVRRNRAFAVALAAALAPVIVVYARFLFWAGDYAWGPRYLVFCVPALTLPAAFVVERVRSRARATALAALLAVGAAVQLIGNAYYWDHWIRISKEVSAGWLGKPNRAGSNPPDRGNICDACFEDLYAQQWLPPFQPIAGHLWLLRHTPYGDDYATAEKDAPWHLYTRVVVPIDEQWYKRARIDWWVLDWLPERGIPATMLAAAILGLPALLGMLLWLRARREPE